MAATYAQLKEQISALQKEAELARKNEVKDAIRQIKETMEKLEITPEDLGFSVVSERKKTVKVAAPPKYKDPASDKTWNGKGVAPKWLIGDRAKFLINQ